MNHWFFNLRLAGMWLALVGGLMACSESRELNQMKEYEGPLVEAQDIKMIMSDSAIKRVYLEADRQLEFKGGDKEFPEGMYLEFFEVDGRKTSTLKAEQGYYYRELNQWKVIGDVVLQGLDTDETLTTEELWWDPAERLVFTDKYVMIREGNTVYEGTGMRAAQDFSWYEFTEFQGSFEN